MNINPIKIQNHNSQQNRTNTSFKSVMPVKIFDRGVLSTNKDFNEQVFRMFISKLFDVSKNPADWALKAKFESRVKDYKNPKGSGKKGELLRYRVLGGVSYLFTGKQARLLHELGKEIGLAKSYGLQKFRNSKTTEARNLAMSYSELVHDFISSHPEARLRESIDALTNAYKGALMGVCVFVESVGKMGKSNHNISLKDVKFRLITDQSRGVNSRYLSTEPKIRNRAA